MQSRDQLNLSEMRFFAFPLILIVTIKACHCEGLNKFPPNIYKNLKNTNNLAEYFKIVNDEHVKMNAFAVEIAWNSSIEPGNPELPRIAYNFQKLQLAWHHNECNKISNWYRRDMLNETEKRQDYLLCRGPRFDFSGVRRASDLYKELESIYSDARICLPTTLINRTLTDPEEVILSFLTKLKMLLPNKPDIANFAAKVATEKLHGDTVLCLGGEVDMQKLIKFSKNEEVLRWVWLVWREKVGPAMKSPYQMLVALENEAAQRNGYTDIGAVWRDEMEIQDLRALCRSLYEDIKSLYTLLHGLVRFFLRKQYGSIVPETGPIPAHLLGDLWSQNWETLVDFIVPQSVNVDKSIEKANWTTTHMVRRAEDFYQSIGLPPMTDTFWRKSVFSQKRDDTTRCHGTAADMFKKDDFRLIYCSGLSTEDFYVLHHEMGHIEYYMAYEQQLGIFRQGNSALHESIGDTIWLGASTPQHLHRLGLINDTILYEDLINTEEDSEDFDVFLNNNDVDQSKAGEENDELNVNGDTEVKVTTDEMLLLKQGLNKLPQIPFALLIDEYRWKYFEGGLNEDENNAMFWKMALELQGIAPPGNRGEEYFDVGAKFHVPDNTPYIRYYLSSFLQHQLFESLCRAAVFGRRHVKEKLPPTISLHRCDIYGSKAAGKILRDIMSRGHSQTLQEILYATIGQRNIASAALKRYYRPLHKLLIRLVHAHRIPIGW